MNKQRKVLITITYNEMGVIIDTKTVELGSSAQPEPCEDTISRQAAIDAFEDTTFTKNEIKRRLSEVPPAQPEQRWIPVTERLPEDDTVVLVCGKSGGVYTAIHNNSKTWIRGWWKMNSKNHHCNPIAWMPLPKPWEGDAE